MPCPDVFFTAAAPTENGFDGAGWYHRTEDDGMLGPYGSQEEADAALLVYAARLGGNGRHPSTAAPAYLLNDIVRDPAGYAPSSLEAAPWPAAMPNLSTPQTAMDSNLAYLVELANSLRAHPRRHPDDGARLAEAFLAFHAMLRGGFVLPTEWLPAAGTTNVIKAKCPCESPPPVTPHLPFFTPKE